jgi:hypothetical protein
MTGLRMPSGANGCEGRSRRVDAIFLRLILRRHPAATSALANCPDGPIERLQRAWDFTYIKTTLLVSLCRNPPTRAPRADTYTSTRNPAATTNCCATPHIGKLPFDRKWTQWIRFQNQVSLGSPPRPNWIQGATSPVAHGGRMVATLVGRTAFFRTPDTSLIESRLQLTLAPQPAAASR